MDIRKLARAFRDRAPPRVWSALSGTFVRACDVWDLAFYRKVTNLPPARLRLGVGTPLAKDFIASGDALIDQSVRLCGLRPDSHVLDVGCGCGRVARPLSHFLSSSGSYEGFDVDKSAIDYCTQAYRNFPSFRFVSVDLRTARYNPTGRMRASKFRFPYDEGSFDQIYLTSVMTHLLPDDLLGYLVEIRRVLKPAGKAWITYFLRAEDVRRAERSTPGRVRFLYPYGDHRVQTLRDPETGICYDESFVWTAYREAHLRADHVYYGSWAGRHASIPAPFVNVQDVVVTSRQD